MMLQKTAQRVALGLLSGLFVIGLHIGTVVADPKHPVVVELFTSQGCSSCPPADTYLGELAKRDDIIALSYHVDYWDYIGWKDTFASRDTTNRQKAYGQVLGQRYVYTPQMVIGGRLQEVGSDRGGVQKAINYVAMHEPEVALTTSSGANAGAVTVHLPKTKLDDTAWIWLVRFDERNEVEIGRGENSGRKIAYHNVVRDIQRLEVWDGSARDLSIDLSAMRAQGGDGCAVFVQKMGYGTILGAVRIAFPPGS